MPILVRDDSSKNLFEYTVYPKKDLPAEYVPWGTLAGTMVVFAQPDCPPPRQGALKPYTAADQKLRRGLCEEALVTLILQRRELVETALTKVNDGVLNYVRSRL